MYTYRDLSSYELRLETNRWHAAIVVHRIQYNSCNGAWRKYPGTFVINISAGNRCHRLFLNAQLIRYRVPWTQLKLPQKFMPITINNRPFEIRIRYATNSSRGFLLVRWYSYSCIYLYTYFCLFLYVHIYLSLLSRRFFNINERLVIPSQHCYLLFPRLQW